MGTSTHDLCLEQKYEYYQNFSSESFYFLVVKFSIYSRTRYLELAYFELPLISKWKSGPCFNMKLWRGNKIMWKRGEIAPLLLFHIISYISNFNSQITYVIVQFIVFLTLSTLICGDTDISKYFSESLGIRDNQSWLFE